MDPRPAPHDPVGHAPQRRRWPLPRRPFGLPAAVAVVGLALSGLAAGPAVAGRLDPGEDPRVVRTDDGPVRGLLAGDHRTFEGIPFAAPPVGPLRWASPRRPTPWTAPLPATRPGSPCAQTGGFPGDPPSDTEDCLYLNVTTPARTDGRKLPVMVWIHGDGFYQSSGGIYGAELLATKGDVVVVTFNYRLGAFGFLAHPALDGPPARRLSGNFGLEDQQAALRWVRRNAAAFGGDPGNVTIFGESAGGASACAHLAAPASAGLFHRAIAWSGPCTLTTQWPYPGSTWAPRPRASAERDGATLAVNLGCAQVADPAACLRAASVPALLAAVSAGGQLFGPVVGGGVLPLHPKRALATGRIHKVPVIHGTTRDEHRTFQAGFELLAGRAATEADYREQIQAEFSKRQAARVMARYPLADYPSPSLALATVWTDYTWSCPALATDRLLAAQVPTWAFEFADAHAPWFRDVPLPGFPTGAFHAAELQYLFSGAYASGQLSPAQQRLSDEMVRAWTRFAHTGNPNGEGITAWPRFRGVRGHVQSLAPGPGGIHPVDLGREHRCGFWQSLGT
jgi:para-nitrobenzyl esterase